MKTIYSEDHALHNPSLELGPGMFCDYRETPQRAFYIRDAIRERGLGAFVAPQDFSLAPILAVHDESYVTFLKEAHATWAKLDDDDYSVDAFAYSFNVQHPNSSPPKDILGKLGFYTADGCVPITATSWEAIKNSAFVALTGQATIAKGDSSVFALCRPPGHHATRRVAAGYCYLNNAAIAAEAFTNDGAKRVAVLDVDYHHGNGTQDIFYDRDDVLFVSIHVDPAFDYPSFCGYAGETGRGNGQGFTINYPLPMETRFDVYGEVLDDAINRINQYGPDALVVSLGVDTYKHDPISSFMLEHDDFLKVGAAIGELGMPVLFVMEGGYAVDKVGHNVVNVLTGFLDRRG
jgi:acetoin utilization deacetylase AcuC-like enzyme